MYVRHKALPTNCPNPPSSPSAPEQNCRHMTDCSGALGLCPLITELLSIFGRATPYSTCATGSATKAPSVPFAHTLVPPLLLIQLAIFSVHAPYFPPPILPVTTVRSASFTNSLHLVPLVATSPSWMPQAPVPFDCLPGPYLLWTRPSPHVSLRPDIIINGLTNTSFVSGFF